ncbi:hypothetical protein [Halomonas heilongjiangensis]|uniref:Uncharacterized protein n=1 Tax=Halomonas heilongjiangensis TaxID=1387883 RepID=A0A2N7TFZ9_9GAMM|nr:hypothetical protein [Halomonas heilongjiangensis]PMR67100.1 hypothetical protein C1H66_20690 [Halomonas heilongjiangensis]PXX87837.1 hypothetical protein CR158_15950 [Halomonas heilongjiangensis]
MGIEEKIFETQLENGVFDAAEVDFAEGLARLAVDKGYDSLSPKQKAVLEPYLSAYCSGVTDPGGHHNECDALLEGEDLLEAYQLSEDSQSLMCESCRSDQGYYQHQWQRISEE